VRVLMVHNYYQQRGGEDVVFELESDLLESNGHEVQRELFFNDSILESRSLLDSGKLAASAIWSRDARDRLQQVLDKFKPDVAHFHNTFPLVSSSAYAACKIANVPVVQTLHNYRPLCSKAQMFRDGRICEDCLGRSITWPGILHGCYRGSRTMSATVSAMQLFNRVRQRRMADVNVFIAISEIVRDSYIAGGFPASSIVVKPHFVDPDPGIGQHQGRYCVYVGRLSEEKGIASLLRAWIEAPASMPLKIVGDGPMAGHVMEAARRNPFIEWLGIQPRWRIEEVIGDAAMLLFPSIWREPFGRTIIEAYARGTPVVAAAAGAPLELVIHGETGLHFEPGNSEDLALRVSELANQPERRARMSRKSRELFEARYTAVLNYRQLLDIYRAAVSSHKTSGD
jgi:glycosyltransferase involved in cell wall biosynthesis